MIRNNERAFAARYCRVFCCCVAVSLRRRPDRVLVAMLSCYCTSFAGAGIIFQHTLSRMLWQVNTWPPFELIDLRRGEGSSQYFCKNPNLRNPPPLYRGAPYFPDGYHPLSVASWHPLSSAKVFVSPHLSVQPRSNCVVAPVFGPTAPFGGWPVVAYGVTIPRCGWGR